jgi:zinc protease
MRHGPGPFVAGAAVDTPNTGAALKEILDEVERFCASPPTPEELSLALGRQVKSLPGRFESVAATARAMADLGLYGLPPDEFRQRPARFGAVTPGQVQTAAARYLDPDDMQIVIAGDLATIRSQLQQVAFGPIEVVDAASSRVIETIPITGKTRSFTCKAP